MKQISNEKGVTLLEVVLAMAILSIILISFLNIFPQMGMMNNFNEEKTQGINTAKELLVEWQNYPEMANFPSNSIKADIEVDQANFSKIGEYKDHHEGDYYFFEYDHEVSPSNTKYAVKVRILVDEEVDSEQTKAHRIYIELLNKDRGTKVSETYGYILSDK
ncbi:prepilin-type N-terminal cleavage/methylation domain-containing protein [Mesobacillus persicus]|uniref:Prepilin-type N-terminal cleavage/methylation domain-containing protein n=1 Tax=Mesobacillus persicus TaxID=930146 RepID=A0A1H7XHM0_9BACI|nr:prepilin-type N-terminal cleavage/methylation domain-containing protein [Mesobacillus persicus]SEM33402.1 prepilin-type N-terminal cleavage/methylation domain-containing protein [Mesobacillus persicus]